MAYKSLIITAILTVASIGPASASAPAAVQKASTSLPNLSVFVNPGSMPKKDMIAQPLPEIVYDSKTGTHTVQIAQTPPTRIPLVSSSDLPHRNAIVANTWQSVCPALTKSGMQVLCMPSGLTASGIGLLFGAKTPNWSDKNPTSPPPVVPACAYGGGDTVTWSGWDVTPDGVNNSGAGGTAGPPGSGGWIVTKAPCNEPPVSLSQSLSYTTPYGNQIDCSNGSCTFNGAPTTIVSQGNGTITIKGTGSNSGVTDTISLSTGQLNYSGTNTANGNAYATGNGTLYQTVNGGGSGGTAQVTKTDITGLSVVTNTATSNGVGTAVTSAGTSGGSGAVQTGGSGGTGL